MGEWTGEGITAAVGLLIGAVAMKLVPAVSDLISGKAKKVHEEAEALDLKTKRNGNGHLTAEQLKEMLANHEQICGGRIEAKMDNFDEKMDMYHSEQKDQWDRINEIVDLTSANQTRLAVQERRLDDHIAAHRQ